MTGRYRVLALYLSQKLRIIKMRATDKRLAACQESGDPTSQSVLFIVGFIPGNR